jgi:hypothetical protein
MGQFYSVQFENVAVTLDQDFFEITPADDRPVKIVGLFLSQSSDAGDAEEEFLRLKIIRGHTSGGSGGTNPTPGQIDPRGAAAGATTDVNHTTEASGGTVVTIWSHAFNIRTGLEMLFPPDCEPGADQGQTTIVVRLMASPSDSLTMSGTLFFEEG